MTPFPYPSTVVEMALADDPAASYYDQILTLGPLAYWRLGEASGTAFADSSGNGRTATQIATAPAAYAQAGALTNDPDQALSFSPGPGGTIVRLASGMPTFAADSWTVMCWFKLNAGSVGTSGNLFWFEQVGSAGVLVERGATGKMLIATGTAGVIGSSFVATTAVTDTNWHHIALTSQGTLYMDGAQVVSGAGTSGTTYTSPYFSISGAYGVAPNSWDGLIDEMSVHSRRLTVSEIQSVYGARLISNPTTWTDVSTYFLGGSTQRGRQAELDTMDAGRTAARFRNTDRRFDPTNTAGPYYGPNLVTNPTFEVDATNWTVSGGSFVRSTALAHSGTASGLLTASGTDSYVSPGGDLGALRLGMLPGSTYTFSVWLYVPSGKSAEIFIFDNDGSGYAVTTVSATVFDAWSQLSVTRTIRAGSTEAFCRVHTGSGASTTVYVDDAMLTLVAASSPMLRPMRRLRIKHTIDAVTYTTALGMIDRWPRRRTGPTWAEIDLTVVDGFEQLARASVYPRTSWVDESPGARINHMLDAVLWPAALRNIDTGTAVIPTPDPAVALGALEHIQAVADADLGYFFISADGLATFHDRYHRLRVAASTTSQATFGEADSAYLPYIDLVPDFSEDHVLNDVTSTIDGGTAQQVEDATSIVQNFRRSSSRAPLVTTDADALAQSALIVRSHKDPADRIEQIVIRPSTSALWAQVLAREIGDRITVREAPVGGGAVNSGDYFIENVQHEFPRSLEWVTTWQLTPVSAGISGWVLDDPYLSLLGSTTVLG